MYCMMYYCIISSNILRLVSTTILTKQCHGNDVHCCKILIIFLCDGNINHKTNLTTAGQGQTKNKKIIIVRSKDGQSCC